MECSNIILLTSYCFLFIYFNLQQKLNLTSLNISHKDFRFKLDRTFVDMTYELLNKISSSRSGKLYFYSNILNRADYKLRDDLKNIKDHR
jgi:hypothetical protein